MPVPRHLLARLDHAHVWHPFTQMQDWLRSEPVVLVSGRGAVLRDVAGREYLDANASIWTNLHGHRHPRIDAAVVAQLRKVAHTSALGLANEPASLLAARLVDMAQAGLELFDRPRASRAPGQPRLEKVFFSDDGSTAIEVALKLAHEVARRTRGVRRPRFLSVSGAYHGDTLGAVSVGKIGLFHERFGGLCFKSDTVMSPYCYRCRFNRARPERRDARQYRDCAWECVGEVERVVERQAGHGEAHAALVVEPRLQGAAGMIPQPEGWLRKVTEVARRRGVLVIADEVMTAFGRAGALPDRGDGGELLASHVEGVQPDLVALAKGLTGGYLPMAATLATRAIFDAFLGRYDEFKTFFHGHSYTGNQLGAAAALASLDLMGSAKSRKSRGLLARMMSTRLEGLWRLPNVGDIRQVGLVAGIELVRNWTTREPFALEEQVGIRVCAAMARRRVLTRPIGNVIVIMPPYCTERAQLEAMLGALEDSIEEVLGGPAARVGRRR